ncbi:MAG: hypothetical protein ACLP3Q_25070 [Streptosporangiaceae bacterium]
MILRTEPRILAYPNLPGRAAQTLIIFTIPLVLMLFVLVPAQDSAALGWELAGGGLLWLVPAVLIALLAGLVNAWVLLVETLR